MVCRSWNLCNDGDHIHCQLDIYKKLVPELRFIRHGFSVSAIREMLAAGIWNCVIKLQQILQDGLSLLVTNLLISPHFMGLLSIAQLVPTTMSGLMGTISGLFSPEQTKFARGQKELLLQELKSGMRICGFFVNIYFCCPSHYWRRFYPHLATGTRHKND